jgi:hypothetical protein
MRVASPPMDESALERVRERIATVAEGRPHPTDVDSALERSRAQIEALAATAAELGAAIPAQVEYALRGGLRDEVLPVARHVAEIRGLFNQSIRRLERIESELLAERKARIDDLALLVELVASGWRGVDARLGRLEDSHAETAASLDELVENLVAEAEEDMAFEHEPAAAEPEEEAQEATAPDASPQVDCPGLPPGFPAQGRQAEAIVERANSERPSTEQGGTDRAAAAA